MRLQIIENSKGKATGVYIPIADWNKLKNKYQELNDLEFVESAKAQEISELREAITELGRLEKGERIGRPVSELLNEL